MLRGVCTFATQEGDSLLQQILANRVLHSIFRAAKMFNISLDSPVGFKEWSLVCEAMGQGTQIIILRKGGIAEGRAGFAFKDRVFFLFPTLFHAQYEGTSYAPEKAWVDDTDPDQKDVTLRYAAEIVDTGVITDWKDVLALSEHHIWKESVLRERFDYDEQECLHLAVVRIARLRIPWCFPYERRFHGCRSWIQLPELSSTPDLEPVINDLEFEERRAAIRTQLSSLILDSSL